MSPVSLPEGFAPAACVKCATLGKTCCQTCEVLVTTGDRLRIAQYTGRRDFWEYRYPVDPAYLQQDDDPNWLRWAFRADGTRPILKRRPNGDCLFLGPRGCRLPMEVRPLVCRLYPYTYTERGLDGVSAGCPPEVVPAGRTILDVLGMRLEDALCWHRILYAELRTKEPCNADWPHLRSAG